jgi:hypothetical protein
MPDSAESERGIQLLELSFGATLGQAKEWRRKKDVEQHDGDADA